MPWMGLGGPILALVAQMWLENSTYSHLGEAIFLPVNAVWAQTGAWLPRMLTIASWLTVGMVKVTSVSIVMNLGSGFESGLTQKCTNMVN